MKKIYCLWLMCLLAGVVAAQSVKELYIFHTNDMHSRIEPFATYFPDSVLAGKAGMLRRATFVKEQRREHKDLLLFDSGDFSQGSPYYNMFKGEVEIKMMNEMGYDAGTIGNHEFDFGLDNMARLFKMAKFPIVCANYDVTGTVLEGLVKEYTIIERNGIRIGVFGLGAELDGLVAHANYGNVKFEDPVSEGQRVADLLRAGRENPTLTWNWLKILVILILYWEDILILSLTVLSFIKILTGWKCLYSRWGNMQLSSERWWLRCRKIKIYKI